MASEVSTKIRILCLHGFRQNDGIFKSKLGSLRKLLKNEIDFVFINAPHSLRSSTIDERSWWFTDNGDVYDSKADTDICIGFEDSVYNLKSFIEEKGPFDGLLGFSQGAAFVAIIASMKQNEEFAGNFKFIILVSAFKSRNLHHQKYYENKIIIPSLHIIGETDSIIDKSRSEELYSIFECNDSRLVYHSGGHHVPATKAFKDHYLTFVKNYK